MKISEFLVVVFISVIVSLISTLTLQSKSDKQNSPSMVHETAFDRIMRTGILRCGYYVFPPVMMRDPNTNKLSGLSVEMMDHFSESTHIKVEWTEETDFANWEPGLKANRFDAMCTPMWPEAALAKEVRFTRPMFYSGINVYARGDDHRFDNNLNAVNSSDVTIAIIEGNATNFTAHNSFPKAKLLSLPQNSPGGLMAESVISKKADVLLWDENGVHDFLRSNPNALHNVDISHPIKVMPFELLVNIHDDVLRDFLDVTLQSFEDTGYTNQLLNKWERAPGDFYRTAHPYSPPRLVSPDTLPHAD